MTETVIKIPVSEVFNMDCMDYMRTIPDKFFELAISDPPYGINIMNKPNVSRGKLTKAKNYKLIPDIRPDREYYNELFRISKNQIIWGGNHLISDIAMDSSCWLVWDKDNATNDFADCELAWTSFKTAVRKFKFTWYGMLQENMRDKETRIHICQKPVQLYKWVLTHYAKPGDKILDTHMGSQSSRIAAYDMGFDYYGTELDPDYFRDGCTRFENHKKQLKLF